VSKVLIIEDDPDVSDLLKFAAERAGHVVQTAANGKRGLESFATFEPDVVVTDILMPEKEGMETIVDLRKSRPATPIIAISGAGAVGKANILEIAQKLGASRTFAKPLVIADLLGAIAALAGPEGAKA